MTHLKLRKLDVSLLCQEMDPKNKFRVSLHLTRHFERNELLRQVFKINELP